MRRSTRKEYIFRPFRSNWAEEFCRGLLRRSFFWNVFFGNLPFSSPTCPSVWALARCCNDNRRLVLHGHRLHVCLVSCLWGGKKGGILARQSWALSNLPGKASRFTLRRGLGWSSLVDSKNKLLGVGGEAGRRELGGRGRERSRTKQRRGGGRSFMNPRTDKR